MANSPMGPAVSIDKHPVHLRFVENLINASHSRELREAALEWELESITSGPTVTRCNVCNQRIKTAVVLHNRTNQNRLIIGSDCYEKFRAFLINGRVATAWPEFRKHARDLHDYWNDDDGTVIGWLCEQRTLGYLPKEILELVNIIEHLGFAPTYADADSVVFYYIHTRVFPIEALISLSLINKFHDPKVLPFEVTIAQANMITEAILAEVKTREFQKSRTTRNLAEEKRQQEYQESLKVLTDVLAKLRKHVDAAIQSGVEKAREVLVGLNRLEADVLVRFATTGESIWARRENIFSEMIQPWWEENCWLIVPVQRVLLVQGLSSHNEPWYINSKNYWLVQKNSQWGKEHFGIEVGLSVDRFSGVGVFEARIIPADFSEQNCEQICVLKRVDDERLMMVNFNVASRSRQGTFVGMHKGKIVLPGEDIRRPQERQVFLTNDIGRYYRAWLI